MKQTSRGPLGSVGRRGFGVFLLGLLLAAVQSAAPAVRAAEQTVLVDAPPPELARIYFYRQAQPLMIAMRPEVIVNGKSVGNLSLGEVFFRDARPGRYEIFLSGDPSHVIELNLGAGDIGYVRATLRIGLGTTRLSAESIEAAEAQAEIAGLGDESDGPKQPENQR